MTSCSNIGLETSSTTRPQTKLQFGGAAINRVSTLPVAMPKLAPMSVEVGAPVVSDATSCKRVLGASPAADFDQVDDCGMAQRGSQRVHRSVEAEEAHSRRQQNPCDEIQPQRPATLSRQQAQLAERRVAAESTIAADNRSQHRKLAFRLVAANVGCEAVPTEVMGSPSVVIVLVAERDHFAIWAMPKRCRDQFVPHCFLQFLRKHRTIKPWDHTPNSAMASINCCFLNGFPIVKLAPNNSALTVMFLNSSDPEGKYRAPPVIMRILVWGLIFLTSNTS